MSDKSNMEPIETIVTGEGVYLVYEEAPAVTEGAIPLDRVSWKTCPDCGAEYPPLSEHSCLIEE